MASKYSVPLHPAVVKKQTTQHYVCKVLGSQPSTGLNSHEVFDVSNIKWLH